MTSGRAVASPSTRSGPYHCGDGEEVGVVAALLEVHDHVEEGHLVPAPAGVQGVEVPGQDELVVFPGVRGQEGQA